MLRYECSYTIKLFNIYLLTKDDYLIAAVDQREATSLKTFATIALGRTFTASAMDMVSGGGEGPKITQPKSNSSGIP